MSDTQIRKDDIYYGDMVKLTNGEIGTVKFIGNVMGKDITKLFYGIELSKGEGRNNGTINNIEYFKTKNNKKIGKFVSRKKISSKKTTNNSLIYTFNDKIYCKTVNEYGIIKYIGCPQFYKSNNIYFGIELINNKGNCDGIVKDIYYFKCDKNKGIYCNINQVIKSRPKSVKNDKKVESNKNKPDKIEVKTDDISVNKDVNVNNDDRPKTPQIKKKKKKKDINRPHTARIIRDGDNDNNIIGRDKSDSFVEYENSLSPKQVKKVVNKNKKRISEQKKDETEPKNKNDKDNNDKDKDTQVKDDKIKNDNDINIVSTPKTPTKSPKSPNNNVIENKNGGSIADRLALLNNKKTKSYSPSVSPTPKSNTNTNTIPKWKIKEQQRLEKRKREREERERKEKEKQKSKDIILNPPNMDDDDDSDNDTQSEDISINNENESKSNKVEITLKVDRPTTPQYSKKLTPNDYILRPHTTKIMDNNNDNNIILTDNNKENSISKDDNNNEIKLPEPNIMKISKSAPEIVKNDLKKNEKPKTPQYSKKNKNNNNIIRPQTTKVTSSKNDNNIIGYQSKIKQTKKEKEFNEKEKERLALKALMDAQNNEKFNDFLPNSKKNKTGSNKKKVKIEEDNIKFTNKQFNDELTHAIGKNLTDINMIKLNRYPNKVPLILAYLESKLTSFDAYNKPGIFHPETISKQYKKDMAYAISSNITMWLEKLPRPLLEPIDQSILMKATSKEVMNNVMNIMNEPYSSTCIMLWDIFAKVTKNENKTMLDSNKISRIYGPMCTMFTKKDAKGNRFSPNVLAASRMVMFFRRGIDWRQDLL